MILLSCIRFLGSIIHSKKTPYGRNTSCTAQPGSTGGLMEWPGRDTRSGGAQREVQGRAKVFFTLSFQTARPPSGNRAGGTRTLLISKHDSHGCGHLIQVSVLAGEPWRHIIPAARGCLRYPSTVGDAVSPLHSPPFNLYLFTAALQLFPLSIPTIPGQGDGPIFSVPALQSKEPQRFRGHLLLG